MSQSSNKHRANDTARTRPRTLARRAPAVGVGSRTASGYLQWAGFVAGAQDEIFGFGAYFVDDESAAPITGHTWTPSGRG
jgi:hypothetical protein